jgi:hypothetical protein
MKTPAIIFSGLSMALLCGCDSKEEQRRERAIERNADALEDAADATRERGEKKADAIERSDPGPNAASTERAADATRDAAEGKADALEDAAKATRDDK